MTKITVDRALIEQALMFAHAVDRPTSRGSWNPTGKQLNAFRDTLRAALAASVVEPAEFVYVDHLGGTEVVIRDPQLPKAAPPPAVVPLLSDEEIDSTQQAWIARGMNGSRSFARAIEQAVRQNAGLK